MKFLINSLKLFFLLILLLVAVYLVGPRPSFDDINPDLPEMEVSINELNEYLVKMESKIDQIKPENEARIIWADSIRQTEYALVYLHGFSAGPMEGAPLHQEVAKRYGMNLYLPRLSNHGIADDDIFKTITPKGLVESAKEALVIARKLGKKVIIMSCSTGSTLALYLSAHYPDVFANVMYSPNIALFDPAGKLITGPWGVWIIKQIVGDYRVAQEEEGLSDSVKIKLENYWTSKYRVEGLVALQALIETTMTRENFKKLKQPYFIGYYYKNDTEQDRTVSVDAILEFDLLTATPSSLKNVIAFPEAGTHVINSPLLSRNYQQVRQATFTYIEEVLKIAPR